jgi:hypothetical protein
MKCMFASLCFFMCECRSALGGGFQSAIKERVKEKGSTSNEGLKVELSNLVYTFVLHDCGVLCWENRRK